MQNNTTSVYDYVTGPAWVKPEHMLRTLAVMIGVLLVPKRIEFYDNGGRQFRAFHYDIVGNQHLVDAYLRRSRIVLKRANSCYQTFLQQEAEREAEKEPKHLASYVN